MILLAISIFNTKVVTATAMTFLFTWHVHFLCFHLQPATSWLPASVCVSPPPSSSVHSSSGRAAPGTAQHAARTWAPGFSGAGGPVKLSSSRYSMPWSANGRVLSHGCHGWWLVAPIIGTANFGKCGMGQEGVLHVTLSWGLSVRQFSWVNML